WAARARPTGSARRTECTGPTVRQRYCRCCGTLGRVLRVLSVPAVAALLVAGCGGEPAEPAASAPSTIAVTSPAFAAGAPIPVEFSCRGANTSPPLSWPGVPGRAAALALVVDDPDAPHGTYRHWVVVDIPPGATSAPAGQPPGGRQLPNSAGHARYDGPCPPSGTHHYRFTVYALS